MTKDQIMQMARDSGLAELSEWSEKNIERFAELVIDAERKECVRFIKEDYVRQFEEPWRQNLSNAILERN